MYTKMILDTEPHVKVTQFVIPHTYITRVEQIRGSVQNADPSLWTPYWTQFWTPSGPPSGTLLDPLQDGTIRTPNWNPYFFFFWKPPAPELNNSNAVKCNLRRLKKAFHCCSVCETMED